MYVRMTRVEGAPDRLDQAATVWQQQVLPTVRLQDGFIGALVLADRATGVGLTVTYWASEAALRASEPDDARRTQISEATGTRVVEADRFEVVLTERTGAPRANTFVRVNDIHGAPDKIDDGIHFVREQVVPALQQLKGYRAVNMGANRASGRVFVSTAWDTAADRDASDAGLGELRQQGGKALGAKEVKVEQFEALFVELNLPAGVGTT